MDLQKTVGIKVAWSERGQIMVKLIFQKIDFLKSQKSFFFW